MNHASQLRAVRAHFGLSQPALAGWLGLSRALLASVETGREQLPAHARPWLRPWVAALADSAPDVGPPPVSEALPAALPTGPAPLLARLAECRYQAQRLGQQLAARRARTRWAQRRLAAGPVLHAALPAPDPTAPMHAPAALRRRWLARLLEEAADQLDPAQAATGPTAGALLAARHRAWLHEAACLITYLRGEGLE